MNYFSSTIGRKQMVGVAGLGLSLFVLVHMAGNMLMFVSAEAYNRYGHALTSTPLIYVAEAGLIAIFLIHLVIALYLTWKNKKAKGSTYAVSPKKTASSFASRTLWAQGMIILGFIVLHLITFKFGEYISVTYEGEEMRDLFALMVLVFKNPIYTFSYFGVLLLLGMHLSHGLASSFQTMGWNGERYDEKVKMIGHVYAALVTVGFISQPFYIFFIYQP
jgi:succinate dehydrogenase / fumarate reductase cytochrome b subunit